MTFLAPSATADSILAWWHSSSTRRSKGLMMALSEGEGRQRTRFDASAPSDATPTVAAFKHGLTNHVVALKAQLADLAGLQDLHPDELNLGLAVLEHLLRCCQQLSIL